MICTGMYILYFVFVNTPIVMVIGRVNYYFVWFYAVLFVKIIYDMRPGINRALTELILYVFLVALFVRTTILLGKSYNIMPYNFNFELF